MSAADAEADTDAAEDAETPETGSETDENLTTVIRAEVLDQVIEQMTSIVSEAILHIGREGLHVKAVDPANVAMVSIDLDAAAFEKVGDGMFPIGINLERLSDYTDGASGSDPVQLAYRPTTGMLNIQHTNVDIDMAAINTDSIRQEPDIPDGLGLNAEFTTPAKEFSSALKNAELASDHVVLTVDVEDRQMTVLGEGDTDDVRTILGDDELIDYNFEESVEALYSLGYLIGGKVGSGGSTSTVKGLMKPIDAGADLEVRFTDEAPMKMSYEFGDGYGDTLIMLAPRIEAR